jgi:hypothetical protein
MFRHRKRPNDTGDGVQGRRQGAGRAIVALLALMMGGGWGLPLPGASGGPAAVCRAAASAASSGIRFQRVYIPLKGGAPLIWFRPRTAAFCWPAARVATGGAVAEVLKINGSGDVLWNKTYRSSSVLGVTQLAVFSFPCHHDSRSNPPPARGGQANESTPVG